MRKEFLKGSLKAVCILCLHLLIMPNAMNVASEKLSHLDYYTEARQCEEKGEFEKAAHLYHRAYETSGDLNFKKEMLRLEGQAYTYMKKYPEALRTYQEYLQLPHLFPFELVRVKTAIAYIYVYQEKYLEAIKILDELKEKYKFEKWGDVYLGADIQFSKAAIYHHFVKDYEKAMSEYKKMIEEYPADWRVKNVPIVLRKIVGCLKQLQMYDAAIAICQEIAKEFSETDWAKMSKADIRIINEYYKIGKKPSEEDVLKVYREMGIDDVQKYKVSDN
ncbi:MAG: hypothetical protein NC906_01545 [Candidatus Omnitrophica bacterium]|nr:hypothetical protein [Candidatus Omnitrophota bacterium]